MAAPIRYLNAAFAVAVQLTVDDVPDVAAWGFTALINNRPDGEGGSAQPLSRDIEQAARTAGLHYVYLPVLSRVPVLAFCRSGARSAQLYQLAQTAA